MKTAYSTKGTCAKRIEVEIEAGIIKRVDFQNGCDGNLQGISSLVVGMDAREAAQRLRGIRCGIKDTSCPDQLALAIEANLENNA